MVIPLSEPANDIIMTMEAQQRRDHLQTNYVFANYRTRFNKSARISEPPDPATVLNNLRVALPPEHIDATLHGMRTSMRSWSEDQRRPDGLFCFNEKDLERAIGHAAGFGKTPMARLYSRQSKDVAGLVPIFDGWAKFVTSTPADVIPFRRKAEGA
jgi:hypothetical protein